MLIMQKRTARSWKIQDWVHLHRNNAKAFAKKLHLCSHLQLLDMKVLYLWGEALTPVPLQALESAVKRCAGSKTNGRPLDARKVYLNKFLWKFNEEVQNNLLWIKELTKEPILYIWDCATGLWVAVLAPICDADVVTRIFDQRWVMDHNAPVEISFDQEIYNRYFGAML